MLALFFFALGSVYAGTIDPALADQMAQNPTAKLHVIAFFKDKLSPEKVIQEMGIRGDEVSVVQQVAEIYKSKAQAQSFLFSQFAQQRGEIEGVCIHPLLNAISFKATPPIICEVAKLAIIDRIALYTPENTKPDTFFLKEPYFELKLAKITCVGEATEKSVEFTQAPATREIDPSVIINILKELWDFIKENQPVVNTAADVASAVPQGITHWQQLAGWREKHTGQYVIEYVNGFGITVVKIVVRVHFYYNGNYNGVGKYITCATTSIDELNVLWGYTLDATEKVPESGIVNIGTAQNPIAGMKMFVHWAVHTIIQHQEGTMTFSLDGQGNISSY